MPIQLGGESVATQPGTVATSQPHLAKAGWSGFVLDLLILLAFLTLAFLLGVFPLNDTDFWWHLRTGDLIRETGQIPRVDPYLFGGPAVKPWIDLHWGFQLLISLGYSLGGIDLLHLVKCGIITVAVTILLIVRPRRWPIDVMALAGLPALLLLGGRMYIRPEILSLFYLALVFVLVGNWNQKPWIAWFLPLVMVFWVNSHGLFVLGLIVIACGLLDSGIRRGAWVKDRSAFWKTILSAVGLSGVACLLNPYGITGALFPLKLLGTMGDPVFATSIAELESVPHFLARAGWHNPNMLLLLGTQALGVLSFLVPIAFNPLLKSLGKNQSSLATEQNKLQEKKTRSKKKSRAKSEPVTREVERPRNLEAWSPSIYRLLLFLFFTVLSWRASRNSQQFAEIALVVTAWNFGEWVMLWRSSVSGPNSKSKRPAAPLLLKLISLGVLVSTVALVCSGEFYRWLGEGRKFGLGEQPLWFPHDAVKNANRPGMPERFVCFHNGHAALWDYHNGPQKQNFADARLEVIGPKVYREYMDLQGRIASNNDWSGWFKQNGWPGLLIDLVQEDSAALVANVLANPDWRCVWFDPIAAVFVHSSWPAASAPIDFSERHFRDDRRSATGSSPELMAGSRAARDVAANLSIPVIDGERTIKRAPRRDLASSLLLNAYGLAHQAASRDGGSADAWKALAQVATLRMAASTSELQSPRYKKPYDPILDLETMRATVAFRASLDKKPDNFLPLFMLASIYQQGQMREATVPLFERLSRLWTINETQARTQQEVLKVLARLKSQPISVVERSWKNLSELDQRFSSLLDQGQVESAAALLESAYPVGGRPWEVINRIGTLRLHLGDTASARRTWEEAKDLPRPAIRLARIGLCDLLDENFENARTNFQAALDAEPSLFEALYGLAVLETDDGFRGPALEAIERAAGVAPGPAAQAAVRELKALVGETGNSVPVH